MYQRVILIDDEATQNKIHTMIIRHYLGRHHIEVVSFTDPVQALLYLEDENENRISTLILLDLDMPYMDGWDFLDHLPPVDKEVTFIYIVTSSVLQSDVERGLYHPKVTGYTKKPLSSAVNGLLVDTLTALAYGDK